MPKKLLLLIILIPFSNINSFGQGNDLWYAFRTEGSNLIGFKDKKGVIKIQPKFNEMTSIIKFDNIIAVIEDTIGTGNSYYLTKSGKIVGKNSLYHSDNTNDCESEGFIRFKDPKNGKVGLFNRMGNIVIPAVYDDLSIVQNGLITGLKGAEKKYFEIDKHKDSEYYYWEGGQQSLMDTLNTTLIENCTTNHILNFYSLKKSNAPDTDGIRESFLGKDGNYYSFIDFEKEFKQWIIKVLQDDLTPEKLIANTYDNLLWDTGKGWKKEKKELLIANNYSLIKNGLLEIVQPSTEYFISSDGLNPFIYEGAEFERYYNNCGEPLVTKYPKMVIYINHYDQKKRIQNSYEFLRTEFGYQLIGLSIRNNTIK